MILDILGLPLNLNILPLDSTECNQFLGAHAVSLCETKGFSKLFMLVCCFVVVVVVAHIKCIILFSNLQRLYIPESLEGLLCLIRLGISPSHPAKI